MPIFTPLALITFTICLIALGFGVRLWLNRSRWRIELPWLIVAAAIVVATWYVLDRFPVRPPIVLPESLHLALSVALAILALGVLVLVVYYRFVLLSKATPRYVQGLFWVLIIGLLSSVFVFR
jgi:hypothetical protein